MAARRKKTSRSPTSIKERLEEWLDTPSPSSEKKEARRNLAFPTNWNDIAIPKAITAEWIENDSQPYLGLEAYLLSLICEAKWAKTKQAVLAELPPGYRLILLFCFFCSDVSNGGLIQFVGSRATKKRAREIVETVEMLRRFGMSDVLNLLRKAISLMGDHVPSAVLATLSKKDREAAAKRRLSDDELIRRGDPLDRRFFRLVGDSKIDTYIKRHPEEFVHEKLSTRRRPTRRRRG